MNKIENTKIVDNSYFSIGFPEKKWEGLISRENIISQIEDLFNSSSLIYIEGEEDSGKTTLSAQFTKKNIKNTISVFFNPLNNLDYQKEFYCTNFVNQVRHILNDETVISDWENLVGIEEHQKIEFQLRKRYKNKNEKLYLVVDGLGDVIKEKPEFVKSILSIMPIGQEFFKIIITGSKKEFEKLDSNLKKIETSYIGLNGFTKPELIEFINLGEFKQEEIEDLYKITKGGLPGRLITLKRLIENDKFSIKEISNTTTYKSWIELDCESFASNTNEENAVVALISLNDREFSIQEVIDIIAIEKDKLIDFIESSSVFGIRKEMINFISNSHKKYLANQYRTSKKEIKDLLIKYYASNVTPSSLVELPKLLAEINQWGRILEVLNDDYLPQIMGVTGSLKVINESLSIGIRASSEMNRYDDLWRFSIQGSIVNEVDNYLFWESEVEARTSILDFTGAISLAETAILDFDRLRLLARIARRQKEIKKDVDEELVELITELYKSVDLSSIGGKIYDIVSDLIYGIPNLAIEMIDKSSGESSDDDINDWIVTKLSVAAVDSDIKDDKDPLTSKKLEAIQNINSPNVRKINRAIAFMVGNYTSDRMMDEVRKLNDSTERLKLMRMWLNNNRGKVENVGEIISAALNELVNTSTKTIITVDTLKELTHQLPYVDNETEKSDLIKRFRIIEHDVEDIGISTNKYVYKLNMIHTIFSINHDKGIRNLDVLINEVEKLEDNLIALDIFAEVYSKLSILKHPKLTKRISFTYKRILELSAELFENTSNHFKISQNLLKVIAKKNPILAIKISENINTQTRRERARMLILDSYLDNNLKYVKIDLIKIIEDKLIYSYTKQELAIRVMERFSEAKSLPFKVITELLFYFEKIKQIIDNDERAYGLVLIYKVINKNTKWKERLGTSIEKQIEYSLEGIEADWEKIDSGYRVCTEIAKISPVFAKYIYSKTEIIKNDSWLDSRLVAYTFMNSVKVIIRSFGGLINVKGDTDDDFKQIADTIQRIPSEIEKLRLWTELGFQCYSAERDDIGKKVLNNHIVPIFQELMDRNIDVERVIDSLTLIHILNPSLYNEFVSKISIEYREDISKNLAFYYLTKRNPFEDYDSSIIKYSSNYSDIKNVITALKDINTDGLLYYIILNLFKAIDENRSSLGKIAISTIAEELDDIIDSKLPDLNNIKHEGYKYLLKMRVAKIKKNVPNKQFWDQLINDSQSVTNLSDQVFLKSDFLANLPFEKMNNGMKIKKDLFQEVIDLLNSFKVHFEYIQRVIDVSDTMYSVNPSKWKEVVKQAFNMSADLKEGQERYSSRKNIIDSIYRTDSVFAKELIKSIQENETPNRSEKLLLNYYKSLEISNKIKNNKTLTEIEKQNSRIVVQGVYSALKALNSDRISSKKIEDISKYLILGTKLPLHEVYPIHVFYLNNCRKKYASNSDEFALTLHKINFREALKSSNLIELLSNTRKMNTKAFKEFFIDDNFISNKAINPGNREAAVTFIRQWLEDEVEDFLIIADPYFCCKDLDILKSIKDIYGETIDIDILGSVDGKKDNVESEYSNYWKKISDEIPPYTTVTFCWIPEKDVQEPFHDRWIITKNGGLRLGTSLNSLGVGKESEISVMKLNESLEIKNNSLKEYITRRKRFSNNLRIQYKSFSLN